MPKSVFKRNTGAMARDDYRVLNDAGIGRGAINHALDPNNFRAEKHQVAYLEDGFALELRRVGSFFVQRARDFPEPCLALCVYRGACAQI